MSDPYKELDDILRIANAGIERRLPRLQPPLAIEIVAFLDGLPEPEHLEGEAVGQSFIPFESMRYGLDESLVRCADETARERLVSQIVDGLAFIDNPVVLKVDRRVDIGKQYVGGPAGYLISYKVRATKVHVERIRMPMTEPMPVAFIDHYKETFGQWLRRLFQEPIPFPEPEGYETAGETLRKKLEHNRRDWQRIWRGIKRLVG